MKIDYSVRTDVGRVRKDNQDSFGVLESRNLFLVCDGMGGGAAGDFASRIAVEVIMNSFESLGLDDIKNVIGDSSVTSNKESMRAVVSIKLANRALNNFTLKYPKLSGMGTTVVLAFFDNRKNLLHVYHVGDSRVYRFRNGIMDQLTKDHSKVNELLDLGKMKEDEIRTAEIQSMLTRAAGTNSKIKVDYRVFPVLQDDLFIMFTDGLNTVLDDNTIKSVLSLNSGNLDEITKQLIDRTNNMGGPDNTTIIALKVKSVNDDIELSENEINGNIMTIEDETPEQSLAEDRLLKIILQKNQMVVPDMAIEKGLFSHPLYLSMALTCLFISLTFFVSSFLKVKHDTKLDDLTGKITGLYLDVRTPNAESLSQLDNAEDIIQKLQVAQEIFKQKDENTIPLKNVEVLIESNTQNFFTDSREYNRLK